MSCKILSWRIQDGIYQASEYTYENIDRRVFIQILNGLAIGEFEAIIAHICTVDELRQPPYER